MNLIPVGMEHLLLDLLPMTISTVVKYLGMRFRPGGIHQRQNPTNRAQSTRNLLAHRQKSELLLHKTLIRNLKSNILMKQRTQKQDDT